MEYKISLLLSRQPCGPDNDHNWGRHGVGGWLHHTPDRLTNWVQQFSGGFVVYRALILIFFVSALP